MNRTRQFAIKPFANDIKNIWFYLLAFRSVFFFFFIMVETICLFCRKPLIQNLTVFFLSLTTNYDLAVLLVLKQPIPCDEIKCLKFKELLLPQLTTEISSSLFCCNQK